MILTACGGQESSKPAEVVTSFLEAVQAGDLKKANTYVASDKGSEDFDLSEMGEDDDPTTTALIKGISNNYKFKKPEEKMIDDNKAEVTVEITSIDFAAVMSSAMEDIFGIAFELASEDQSEDEYNKAMEEKSTEILTNAMTSKDAKMVTRDVTLTLEKDDEGKFEIVSDEQLMEAILGNASEVEDMFSGME